MASLGGGRTYSFGSIDRLRASEVEVLKALMNWNHAAQRANYRGIAAKCGMATSTTSEALYYLSGRGVVKRSIGKSWFILPHIKDQLIQEFGHKDSSQASKQAQHTPEENNPDPVHPV